MQIITKHGFPAWIVALSVLACAFPTRADVGIDQLSFVEQDNGYAVKAKKGEMLEGILNIPAAYEGKAVTEIAPAGFLGQVKLTEVQIPTSVVSIGVNAFEGCESLAKADFPSSVETIGAMAFTACRKLAEVTVPASVKKIEEMAFTGSGIEKLIISEGITNIDAHAFEGLGQLRELQLPKSLKTIGERAFNGAGITEVRLPENLKSIGDAAFFSPWAWDANDNKIKKVIVEGYELPEGLGEAFYTFYGSVSLEIPNVDLHFLKYPSNLEGFNIHNNYEALEFTLKTQRIGGEEFNYYEVTPKQNDISGLTDGFLFIPGDYAPDIKHSPCPVRIADIAFKNCKGLQFLWLSGNLEDIDDDRYGPLPAIGDGAFIDSDLTFIQQLPGESIGKYAFSGCESLVNVNFPEKLKRIGESAFANCTSLEGSNYEYGLRIPESVEEIAPGAFAGCTRLEQADLPEGLKTINMIFEGCENLRQVYIPRSVTEIYGTFAGCKNLEYIELPERLKTIGEYSFMGCTSLKEIKIPDSVEKIDFGAFVNCTNLQSINIPDGIKEIAPNTFISCKSLNEIALPKTIEKIGIEAFSSSGITKINLPKSIRTIESMAFWWCFHLKEVYYDSPLEPLAIGDETHVFSAETYETATLYVPESALEAIKTTAPWCHFKDIQIGEFSGIEDVVVDNDAPIEIYNLGGVKVGDSTIGLAPGIYLQKQGAKCIKIAVN